MDVIQAGPELEVAHLGPPLEKGHMPAVFYFALSSQESLEIDPYNQPAIPLIAHGVRLFSFNLPAHGPNLNAIDAIQVWAEEFKQGRDLLSPFFDQVAVAIEALVDKGLIVREKIGAMGLSRGGFVAMHIAARCPLIRYLVAFAPMVDLKFAKEFANVDPNAVSALDLKNQIPSLAGLPIKFFLGNHDNRVGTHLSFDLIAQLSNRAFENGLRSPPQEMVVSPSIGHMGHGTSKETFELGAYWLGKKLGAIR